MFEMLSISLNNLLSPPILFFFLGLVSGVTTSDLELPSGLVKTLSIYLMLAIGLKGGVELSKNSLDITILLASLFALLLAFTIPFIAYGILSVTSRQSVIDRIAIAAHYGSTSIVTFITAIAFLDEWKVSYEGYFVMLLALMEFPSIFTALYLKAKKLRAPGTFQVNYREIIFSGTTILLFGALIIGAVIGEEGKQDLDGFVVIPFKGALCLFLMGLGMDAGTHLKDFFKAGWRLIAFGVYMPLINSVLGILAGTICGLSLGGTMLFAVLAASSSYIVVPAAMKFALPKANPGLYLPLSLGVTFPFNIMLGIPIYYWMANLVG